MEQDLDTQQSGSKSKLRSLIDKVGKWLLYALGLSIAAGALAAFSVFFQNQLDLNYQTTASCKKHSSSKQICTSADGSLSLRHVERGERRLSESFLALDEETGNIGYVYRLIWLQDCVEGTEITLSETFSDGDPMRLLCADNSLRLSYQTSEPSDISIHEFGFSIDHDYRFTNYSPLERLEALKNAGTREARLKREKQEAQKKAEDEALARLLEEERGEKERQRRIEQQKERERIKQAEAERKKLERERLAAQLEKAKADAAAKEEEERLAKARREREAAKRERARIQAARVAKQQKVAHLMPANFFSGSLRLKSGFSAGYKNGNVRNLISGALTRGDYVRLANLVVGTVPNGQNYYLLGRAAEGYEAHAAALTYYRTALRMNEDCLGACAIGYSRSMVLDAIERVSAAM